MVHVLLTHVPSNSPYTPIRAVQFVRSNSLCSIVLPFPLDAACQNILVVCLSHPTTNIHSSPLSISHAFSVFWACPVHVKKKGSHDLVLYALNPQQPHSKSSTAKDEKDNLEQINTAFHLFMNYNRAEKRSFCPLKQSNCIKDHI